MKKILIIGTGGLAREFTSWFAPSYEIVGYCSNDTRAHSQFSLPGKYFGTEISPTAAGTDLAVIAIGDSAVKQKLQTQFKHLGFKFPFFIHPSSVVAANAELADGVVIAPHCTVAPYAKLHTGVYLNFNCGIGHESEVGSFTQINPGVQIGGATKIGNAVLVGSGATILQGLTIGDNATVASGAVVFTNVVEQVTVIGNPAKRLPVFENTK